MYRRFQDLDPGPEFEYNKLRFMYSDTYVYLRLFLAALLPSQL